MKSEASRARSTQLARQRWCGRALLRNTSVPLQLLLTLAVGGGRSSNAAVTPLPADDAVASARDSRSLSAWTRLLQSSPTTGDASTYSGPDVRDPIPSLLSGNEVTHNVAELLDPSRSHYVRRISGDGVTQVLLIDAARADRHRLRVLSASGLPSDSVEADGGLAPIGENPLDSARSVITVHAVTQGSSRYILALYRAPIDFITSLTPDIALTERPVFIESVAVDDHDNPIDEGGVADLSITRPPVVLVHGLWDTPAGWDNFQPVIEDSRFHVYKASYWGRVGSLISETSPAYDRTLISKTRQNSLGAEYVAPLLRTQFDAFVNRYRHELNAAATQADVIAHSFGGLATRYSQLDPAAGDTFGKGRIHKLVTIGTPHRGTPLATMLLSEENPCIRSLLASHGYMSFSTVTLGQSVTHGAVGDQVGDGYEGGLSSTLQRLLHPDKPSPPMATLTGTATDHNFSGIGDCCVANHIRSQCGTGPTADRLIREFYTPAAWPRLFRKPGSDDLEPSDAIVPLSSQRNMSLPMNGVEAVVHSRGTRMLGFLGPDERDAASGIPSETMRLLNLPVTDRAFVVVGAGAPPGGLPPAPNAVLDSAFHELPWGSVVAGGAPAGVPRAVALESAIVLILPAGAQPGETIQGSVTLRPTAGPAVTISAVMVVTENPIEWPDVLQKAPFSFSITIPFTTPWTTCAVRAFATTSDGQRLVSQPVDVLVGPSSIETLRFGIEPGRLEFGLEGGTFPLAALTTFNGQSVEVTEWSGLYFRSLDPTVATVTADGQVTAVAAGTTAIQLFAREGNRFLTYSQVIVPQLTRPLNNHRSLGRVSVNP